MDLLNFKSYLWLPWQNQATWAKCSLCHREEHGTWERPFVLCELASLWAGLGRVLGSFCLGIACAHTWVYISESCSLYCPLLMLLLCTILPCGAKAWDINQETHS